MAHDTHGHVDPVSGTTTTGHEWDGIAELNTPLPRWWLWTFYATIAWAFAYMVAYPAWPLVSSYTEGLLGWHSREAIVADLDALKVQRATMTTKLAETPLEEVSANPELLAFARAQGKAAFGDNCAPCHGAGGGGAKGYPNLNDDDWLWGGKITDIEQTVRYGIRSAHAETRQGSMPAFGRDGVLKRPEIAAVIDYVRSLSNLPLDKDADLETGARVYAETCAACHGEKGDGNQELGAPSLADKIWLYGSDRTAIMDTLWNSRAGMMPARLFQSLAGPTRRTTVKALTVYVQTLGGGEK
jgi:cytochrome c oxidase cbb3-type subunit 3